MMMTLLVLKSRIGTFYEKHYRLLRCVLKILLVFVSLLLIRNETGYSKIWQQYIVMAVSAVVCGFLPDSVAEGFLFLVIFWNLFSAMPVLALLFGMVLLIYYLLLGRNGRGQGYVILLVPILSALHLGALAPLAVPLFSAPYMLFAVVMGVFLDFFLHGVAEYVSSSGGAYEDTIWKPFRYLADYLFQNRWMLVVVLAFAVSFLCVYMIRRTHYRYSSQIAILSGTLILLVVELSGNIILNAGDALSVALQSFAAMGIAYVVQFFRITLDYHGTRKLQFEDDEYYYYVTAIPKYKVAVVEKTVTRIVSEDVKDGEA